MLSWSPLDFGGRPLLVMPEDQPWGESLSGVEGFLVVQEGDIENSRGIL